ncbi:hypothetical protein ACUXCC_000499 [Cytobacillus horneckiae]|uniref:Uncharacterized protein n=1 Tax=Cytobacillus horneckiae TaxID=549687 RepID=A0A2N0ZDV0_9BACI|nr:hypothetical protein [Cytobacillus horneckiae]MBN6885362.1 hypothetical protein [Cytobacillus horneckiae]MEC1154125.1 hypothetical protein [Cytobacillus horneckiae]MED2936330.1 hypothetical protein [Cytobacillus horneckiae]PKG27678.1 hypothetical protein CWS20_17655 [Cytobacillus horneckiae]
MIGKRLNEIKGYENIGMYVKFLKKEYLDDLLNGTIYMKNFNYFIELEKKTKEKGQGDKLEVSHVVRSTRVKLIDPKTGMVIATSSSGEMVERYRGTEKMPLFCLTHFQSSDFVITKVENEIITAKIDISLEDQILFEETFGDTAVILTNEFTDRMIESSNKLDLGIAIGDVRYQDYKYYSATRKQEFDELSVNILFWKDNFFKQQREVRFILTKKSVDEYYKLNIGDIRDKSKVTSTKELLSEDEFEFAII